jgi:PEP-CTERM motif
MAELLMNILMARSLLNPLHMSLVNVGRITMRKLLLGTALSIFALGGVSGSANATPLITGQLWEVTNAAANNATQAEVAAQGAAQVTFQASGVEFSSYGNPTNTGNPGLDYTIGSFLNSLGSASSIVVTAAGTTAGVSLTDSLNKGGGGVLIDLTGSAFFTNGDSFTVTHDDGVTFLVNGLTVLSAPGPTAPTTDTFTYTGSTGTQSFDFAYGECCGAPAVLETTLVPSTSVPEPGTLAILGTVLIGFGAMRRRWRT